MRVEGGLYIWEVIQPMLFGAMANEASNSRRDYKRTKLQDKADLREVKGNRKKEKKFPMAELQTWKKKTGNKLQQQQRNITECISRWRYIVIKNYKDVEII